MYDEFVSKLVDFTRGLKVADPIDKTAFTGPVIDEAAVDRYLSAVNEVKEAGGEILVGGETLDEGLPDGNFVAPTVAAVDESSWVWDRELTAGLFSKDESEIEQFFDRIEAGVTYVNRRAGATTGAWPDIQSFGGWKGSGTSGAGGGGPWYLRSYLREEQSRTIFS